MTQSPHDRIAELHNLASHAHAAAAVAHGKGDYLAAHELTRQAHEHSLTVFNQAGKTEYSMDHPRASAAVPR